MKNKKSSQSNFSQFKDKLLNQNIGDNDSLNKSDCIELADNITVSVKNSVTIIGFREGETVIRPVDGLGFVEVKQSKLDNINVSLRDKEEILVEPCVNEKSLLLSKRNDSKNEYIIWKGNKKVEFSLEWDDNNNNNNNNKNNSETNPLTASMEDSMVNDGGMFTYYKLSKGKNVCIKNNNNVLYSKIDTYDINWSFSQFIELYPMREIIYLLPVLFICLMYLYYKMKALYVYCIYYYRDFWFFSFSVLPVSIKSNIKTDDFTPTVNATNSVNDITVIESESKIWVNPVPKPIKVGSNKYDWSKVELWELERIKQSRWDTSSEYKMETLKAIDKLNEGAIHYGSSLSNRNIENYVWDNCKKWGLTQMILK